MTIIRPNKNEDIRRLVTLLTLGLAAVALLVVFLYMQTVTLRHDIAKKRNTLEILKEQVLISQLRLKARKKHWE